MAVFELVFVFRLGGPTPSEAAGGRPQTERSKTLGLIAPRLRFRIDFKKVFSSFGTPLSNDAEERQWRKYVHRAINVRNRNPRGSVRTA